MKISWTRQATANIIAAHEYIYESNPAAADRQRLLILDAIYRLAQFPMMGREGRAKSTRELAIAGTPYIVVYRVRSRSIAVVAVMHGAQRWPSQFKN